MMMSTDTGLHPHQAWRHIGKPCFHLPARPLLTQHNRTLSIVADDMERVLFQSLCRSRQSRSWTSEVSYVLLGSGAPCQLPALAGQEHGRTIPLADMSTRGM